MLVKLASASMQTESCVDTIPANRGCAEYVAQQRPQTTSNMLKQVRCISAALQQALSPPLSLTDWLATTRLGNQIGLNVS